MRALYWGGVRPATASAMTAPITTMAAMCFNQVRVSRQPRRQDPNCAEAIRNSTAGKTAKMPTT